MEEQLRYKKQHSEKDGYLETSKAKRAVWLMKCPPVVSRSLSLSHSNSDPPRPVAKIVVSIYPLNSNDNDDPPPQFFMELARTEAGHIPRCYVMNMSTDSVPMEFSNTTQGKISVEGKILHKFHMRPHNQSLELFGKLCRERTNKHMAKSKQIHVIHNDIGAHMRPMPGMKTPALGKVAKRKRKDRGEMEEIVFKLFVKQPSWSLRNLIHETDNPEQLLRDILKDFRVYNNKGANHGMYELKSEYRKPSN